MINKLRQKSSLNETSSIFKGMLTLLKGAGLARLIGIVSIPILARIYTPEDYGILALYVSFVTILMPIMTLRYVQAIPLPRMDVVAFNLFSLCSKLIVFFSVLLGILLYVWGGQLLAWFNMEALMPWRWLIVIGAAGAATYELFSLWATRKKQYQIIAKTQVTQSFIGNLVKIGLGLLAFKSSGMIIGQFISQSAGIVSFIKNARQDFKAYLPKVQKNKEKFVAKYYQDFVWFRLPSQFLLSLTSQAPVMMMAALYSKEATGQLSLAMMAMALPVGLIGGAISKAYYAEIAAVGKRDISRIRLITLAVQKRLFLIGIPITILIMVLAKPLFVLIFGEQWALAGVYATILSPYILLQFTSNPLIQILNIIGSQLTFLVINIIRILGLVLIYIWFNYNLLDEIKFIYLLSAYLFLYYFAMTFFVLYLLRVAVNFKDRVS